MHGLLAARDYPVACVVALAPDGLAQARYLCKKLRASVPAVRIIAGRWGPGALPDHDRRALLAAGADQVGTTLLESRTQLYQLVELLPRVTPGSSASGAPLPSAGAALAS